MSSTWSLRAFDDLTTYWRLFGTTKAQTALYGHNCPGFLPGESKSRPADLPPHDGYQWPLERNRTNEARTSPTATRSPRQFPPGRRQCLSSAAAIPFLFRLTFGKRDYCIRLRLRYVSNADGKGPSARSNIPSV